MEMYFINPYCSTGSYVIHSGITKYPSQEQILGYAQVHNLEITQADYKRHLLILQSCRLATGLHINASLRGISIRPLVDLFILLSNRLPIG